jgi:hypothetical protein
VKFTLAKLNLIGIKMFLRRISPQMETTMTLEEMLGGLTAALNENTAELKRANDARPDAIAAVREAAAAGKAPAKKATDPKPAEATKALESAAAKSADACVTDEQAGAISAKVGEYVSAATRDEERVARRAKMRELLLHPSVIMDGTDTAATAKVDVKNVKGSAYDTVIATISKKIEQGDLTSAPAATSGVVDL